jgi:hypothetical protein
MNPDHDLDHRLTRALEAAPSVAIPADFAVRISACLPAQPARRVPVAAIPSPGIGRRVWLAGLVVLFVAVFGLTLSGGPANQPARIALESTLSAEFILLTLWFTLRPQSLR